MANHAAWEVIARYQCKMLKSPIPQGENSVEELKQRLRMWERGEFRQLISRVIGQQAETARKGTYKDVDFDKGERLSKATKDKAAAGAPGKAVRGLVRGVQHGSPNERRT